MRLQYKKKLIVHALADLLEQVFPVQGQEHGQGAETAGRGVTDEKSPPGGGREAAYPLFPYDSGKLAAYLKYIFPLPDPGAGEAGAETLDEISGEVTGGEEIEPMERLVKGFELSEMEENTIILAGITHEHEALSEIFRMLNPYNKPYPTVALAAQLFCPDHDGRKGFRGLLESGPALKNGIIRLDRENPFFEKNLMLMEKLWPVLGGIDAWPDQIVRENTAESQVGLSGWFQEKETGDALAALASGSRCYIAVTDDGEEVAFRRACALVDRAGIMFRGIVMGTEKGGGELENLISVHAAARGIVPVISVSPGETPCGTADVDFTGFPGPVVIASDSGVRLGDTLRPLIRVQCPPLSLAHTAGMWKELLPQLSREAGLMAVRYPLEPWPALQASLDLAHLRGVTRREPSLSDLDSVIRSRTRSVEVAGIRRVQPRAGWDHLVLGEEKILQLREARDRLMHQVKVLDEWAFLKDRRGAYGVRMLFSGPSGTGKTLSSEVMAHELGLELLVIDLSRVVSKWIGETEKNLARIFHAAEKARAVLLFDEADALFGKRTEVSDAHDRYANLETAYLLARLERFEGLAILATNLRRNIDTAFMRRLEFVVEFEEPDRGQRILLWEKHIPDMNLLHGDVNLPLLASFYPMVGGMIRNAAVAAAFLAASEGGPITGRHMIKAIRREYEKAGKSFPGMPPGMTIIKEGYYDHNKSQRIRGRSG